MFRFSVAGKHLRTGLNCWLSTATPSHCNLRANGFAPACPAPPCVEILYDDYRAEHSVASAHQLVFVLGLNGQKGVSSLFAFLQAEHVREAGTDVREIL